MRKDFLISVVIPVMNEEGNITVLVEKLNEVLKDYSRYELIFVNDGSKDSTLEVLKNLNRKDRKIKYLSLSKNFGHQNALKAGLDNAKGDCVISLDGDLQHPPELIPQLIEKWQEGYDVVYTIRKDDPKTGIFKKLTAGIFYKIINSLSDIEIKQGSADYRLLDRSVVEVIRPMQEGNLFFRGIIPWLGFKQFGIEYMPQERFWGESKYSIRKMYSFALEGITGFSIKPLHFSIKIGSFFALLSFSYVVYAVYIKLFTDKAVEGWTSLISVVLLIGGIQLIMIGIVGEYLGKLFLAQKKRPNYIIMERSDD